MSDHLHFNCPHCRYQYNDDWEMLSFEAIHRVARVSRGQPLLFQTKECLFCVEESAFVWKKAVKKKRKPYGRSAMFCHTCGTSVELVLRSTKGIGD